MPFTQKTIRVTHLVYFYFNEGGASKRNENLKMKKIFIIAADWSSAALSFTPSILFQNFSPGKHILYAKYPSEYTDVLEYHLSTAPN